MQKRPAGSRFRMLSVLLATLMLLSCFTVAPISVSAAYQEGACDLEITELTWTPAAPKAGDQVYFNVTITNNGSVASPSNVKHGVALHINNRDDARPVCWTDTHYDSIPAGGSVTLTTNGGNPYAYWPCGSGTDYTVIAVLDDQDLINESNENNNVVQKALEANSPEPETTNAPAGTGACDLIVSALKAVPTKLSSTEKAKFAVTITNIGETEAAAADHEVSVYTDGKRIGTAIYNGALAKGASTTVLVNTDLYSTVGAHIYTAYVNRSTEIIENNFDNNYKTSRITTVQGTGAVPYETIRYEAEYARRSGTPGIATEHAGYSGTGFVDRIQFVGDSVIFDDVEVPNSGYYTMTVGYAAATNGFDGDNVRTMSVSVNDGAAKQQSFPNTGAWATWGTTDIMVYLEAGVNTVSFVYGSADNGNLNLDYIDISKPTTPVVDLTVEFGTDPEDEKVDGDVVTLPEVIVTNRGETAVPAGTDIVVEYRIDNQTIATVSTNKGLAAGAETRLSADWTADVGTHELSAVVDPDGLIAEVDESNNTAAQSYRVSPQPGVDFIITDITWTPTNPQDGDEVTFKALVKNQGTYANDGAFNVKFTVGDDVIYSDDVTTPIDAEQTLGVEASTTWTASKGEYTISAVVNEDGAVTETKTTNNTFDKTTWIGRGANLGYITYEAEDGVTNAEIAGPNRLVGDLGGEASGRRAVKLENTGDYVEWEASSAANSIVVRSCIPDAPGGGGIEATISLYVNGVKMGTVDLTSAYSWLYGAEDNPGNTPGGQARHIYDDANKLLDFTINKGDIVRLQKDSGDTASYYGIDFIDLELVAPAKQMPAGFVSITDYGAVDGQDATSAIQSAIWQVQLREAGANIHGVWIPEGTFYQSKKLQIAQWGGRENDIEIRGAGIWYSRLVNDSDSQSDWGEIGFNLDGSIRDVTFSDFAMFSGARNREGGGKTFCNASNGGIVTIDNIWVEHTTSAAWIGGASGQTDGMIIENCRFRNTGADGINLCNHTKNSVVRNTNIRGSGDDGIAIWSADDISAGDNGGCQNNLVENCTVELPWRANCYTIYGGSDNTIQDCIARDTLVYSAVAVSAVFEGVPFSGINTVQRCTLDRCGGAFWNGIEFGALWIVTQRYDVFGIRCKDIIINAPTYSGIELMSETYNTNPIRPMYDVELENITVTNAGTNGVKIRKGTIGEATFINVKVINPASDALLDLGNGFEIIREGDGNTGW